MKAKNKSRGKSPNYKGKEINRLLDVVAGVKTLGANGKAVVATMFNDRADQNKISVVGEQDSLKKKFDTIGCDREEHWQLDIPSKRVRSEKHLAGHCAPCQRWDRGGNLFG